MLWLILSQYLWLLVSEFQGLSNVFFDTQQLNVLDCTSEFRLLRRVTFLLQPNKVTKQGRHDSFAPEKELGFPFKLIPLHAAPELAYEKHVVSDMLA
jgi:hypothetical protein